LKILLNKILVFACLLLIPVASFGAESNIKIPSGFSDTAFERAFDNALEDAEKNQVIEWNDGYDTPTPDQTFNYFLNFSTFTDTEVSYSDTNVAMDTRTINRSDVPVKLHIIEKFDTATLELIDYYKEVARDT